MSRPTDRQLDLDRQVTASLRVYLDRGEFDGRSLDQARQCLGRAGYPWSSDVRASVQRVVAGGGLAPTRLPAFSPARAYREPYREQDEAEPAQPTPQEIELDVLSMARGGGRW